METQITPLNIIGIAVRTTNENETSSIDIPQLWETFLSNGIQEKIPNKIDNTIYCLYTDYEKDYLAPYTTVLGCAVSSLNDIPEGFTAVTIDKAKYSKRVAKGNLQDGIVFNEWISIWNSDLNRAYTTDFEVYGEKSKNPENAEVEIFVGIN
jgi:predicted transcriptional regulator YdeE